MGVRLVYVYTNCRPHTYTYWIPQQRSWNFFALDLKNEPHGDASWGDSNPKTDFNHYAERTIVQLNQAHPEWTGLYVVEGVGDHADVSCTDGFGRVEYW